jgi:hypothetical protein
MVSSHKEQANACRELRNPPPIFQMEMKLTSFFICSPIALPNTVWIPHDGGHRQTVGSQQDVASRYSHLRCRRTRMVCVDGMRNIDAILRGHLWRHVRPQADLRSSQNDETSLERWILCLYLQTQFSQSASSL